MAKKYSINVYTKYEGLIPVVGERVKSKVAPGYWFILHRSVDCPKMWTITETQSGLAVVKDCETKVKAIKLMEFKLEDVGLSRLNEVIEEVIAANGIGVVNYDIVEVK